MVLVQDANQIDTRDVENIKILSKSKLVLLLLFLEVILDYPNSYYTIDFFYADILYNESEVC